MTIQAEGRIFSSGQANTLYVSIPSLVAEDSAFPFEQGDSVTVTINGDELQITHPGEEYSR